MAGDDVTLTPATLAGRPVAEVKAMAQKSLASLTPAQRAQAEPFIKDMDTPNVLTLSADGKTLATNKAKDKNAGPGMTLTKP